MVNMVLKQRRSIGALRNQTMNIFYSVLGIVAVASDKMSRFRMNLIPSNWGIIAVSGFWGIYSLYALFADKDTSGLLIGIPALIVALLFVTCLLTRNTVFPAAKRQRCGRGTNGAVRGSGHVLRQVAFAGESRAPLHGGSGANHYAGKRRARRRFQYRCVVAFVWRGDQSARGHLAFYPARRHFANRRRPVLLWFRGPPGAATEL